MAAKEEKTKKAAPAAKSVAKAAAKPATKRPTTRKAKPPEITDEMIAERAYYLAISGEGSSDEENWLRAEAELKA
jgi:Protein of unknown function (DUF2934)